VYLTLPLVEVQLYSLTFNRRTHSAISFFLRCVPFIIDCVYEFMTPWPADSEAAEHLLSKTEVAILLREQLQETSSQTLAVMEANYSQTGLPPLASADELATTPSLLTPVGGASFTEQFIGGNGGRRNPGAVDARAVQVQVGGTERQRGESSGSLGGGISFPDMPWDADLSEMDRVGQWT
jgi:hypothetical protein